MSDVARIARNLTQTQRDTISFNSSHVGCVAATVGSASALVAKGLARRTQGYPRGTMLDWTPLGLAVFEHIRQSLTKGENA